MKLVDRAEMIQALKKHLHIFPKSTAIVTVDMHRGHLDPQVATMPVSPEDSAAVIKSTERLLGIGRDRSIPVIHVVLTMRMIPDLGSEILNAPFACAVEEVRETLTPGRKSTIGGHNLEGSVQTEIIPSLYQKGDYVINNKKRLSCFYGTDLEVLLRELKVDTVVLTGINTNTCVLNTAFDAANRDFKTIVIADCVASMYGEDLHVFGLQNISRCLGWVLTVEEFAAKLEAAQRMRKTA